jgi:hypothetical protein
MMNQEKKLYLVMCKYDKHFNGLSHNMICTKCLDLTELSLPPSILGFKFLALHTSEVTVTCFGLYELS